jgi:hypothetical protein
MIDSFNMSQIQEIFAAVARQYYFTPLRICRSSAIYSERGKRHSCEKFQTAVLIVFEAGYNAQRIILLSP